MPKLKFAGEYNAQGQPLEYFEGVPARDLDERDIARIKRRNSDLLKALTRERKTAAGVRPALYREVAPPKPAATSSSSRTRPSRAKPKPAPEPTPPPVETEPAPPANQEPAE